MNRRSLAALIVLNLALVAALAATLWSPVPAEAQFGAANQYLMISGIAQGRRQQAAIYIVNTTTGQIVPLMYNTSNNNIDVFVGRDIGRDAQAAVQQR